jgi:hypothetical protein
VCISSRRSCARTALCISINWWFKDNHLHNQWFLIHNAAGHNRRGNVMAAYPSKAATVTALVTRDHGHHGKPHRSKLPLILSAVVLATLTGWISLLPERPSNVATLADVGNDEQVSLYACIFGENSVRRHIEPQKVAFDSCGAKDNFKIALSTTEVSVSGIAYIIGDNASIIGARKLPFTVTMQRSKPETGKYGFVLLRIET